MMSLFYVYFNHVQRDFEKSALCQQRVLSASLRHNTLRRMDTTCIDVLLHSEYRILPWCNSSIIHVHLSKSRLACTVSNVTLNNVLKLEVGMDFFNLI